jgi:hypothetical protein
MLPLLELLELLEPSGPASWGGLHGPQTPEALPIGTTQVSPGQQSALTVHLPHFGTHVPPV